MKNFYKKFTFLLPMLCAGTIVMAQNFTYKTISRELNLIQNQFVPDKRVAILEVELKDTLQTVFILKGETDLPEAKEKIISYLQGKNVPFIDSLKLLPDQSVAGKIWALSTLSVSNLRLKPDDASELVSQSMMGTPLKVLESKIKWFRVQTPDNYIGWMDSSGLKLLDSNEMESWKRSDRCFFNKFLGYAFDAPGKNGEIVSDLVLGDIFEVTSIKKGFVKMKFPDGRVGYVRKSDCLEFDDWSNTKSDANSMLSVAMQMMGSPYLWGGTSSKATDCSGFVKLVYFSQGIILARDASQQAKYGESLDFSSIENLEPGDLLFFGRSAQKISHEGIYLGDGDFIHSSGRVRISSIDPGDPKYNVNRKNVAACRVLNSKAANGIVRVKDHPWYVIQPK